jgi:hypothetical protein
MGAWGVDQEHSSYAGTPEDDPDAAHRYNRTLVRMLIGLSNVAGELVPSVPGARIEFSGLQCCQAFFSGPAPRTRCSRQSGVRMYQSRFVVPPIGSKADAVGGVCYRRLLAGACGSREDATLGLFAWARRASSGSDFLWRAGASPAHESLRDKITDASSNRHHLRP